MILEYQQQPETGENWLKVTRTGSIECEVWRPVAHYHAGAEILHLSPTDRARLDRLASTGLLPRVRATASEWYTLRTFGGYGLTVTSNANTTTREPNATLVLPHTECYEYAGMYYEQ